MKGPYFTTILEADIRVRPDQMDNNIMDNIKRNLEKTYVNKCYENYGYIDRIYDIDDDIKGGIIRAEDANGSAIFRVKFTCRICNPIKKTTIMGRIIGINNMIIVAENGPIKFIIGENEINKNNIQFRKNAYYPISAKGDIINNPIGKGSYVMIQVMNKKIVKNKTTIYAFGRLENIIFDDKVADAIRNQYESGDKVEARDLISKMDKTETNVSDEVASDDTSNIESEESEDTND